jgi:NAD(P)-dependent dehydrogenase (short-subunit alcohol dehydrogenase family)
MGKQLAIVTGASSGIGYNLAKVFAENGFDLVIASNGERLDKAETDLKAFGAQVTAVQSAPCAVAKQGYEALMKGEKHTYAASLKTKVEGAVANFVPDAVKASMHEKVAKPLHR